MAWAHAPNAQRVEETKVIIPRVTRYGRKPRTAGEALRQARALLAEEGQWAQGHFFEDGDPEDAYEASSCGSWSACAMGALGLVTGEMPVRVVKTSLKVTEQQMKYDWRRLVQDDETEQSFKAYKKEHKNDTYDEEFAWDESSQEFDSKHTPISAKAAQYLNIAMYSDEDPGAVVSGIRDAENAIEWVINRNDSGLTTRTDILAAFDKAAKLAAKPLPSEDEFEANEDY